MAICKYCHQEMETADTCTANTYVVFPDGTRLPASTEHFGEPGGRCHDCGIKHGGHHHPGCDVERCPRCGMQLITCGCLDPDSQPKKTSPQCSSCGKPALWFKNSLAMKEFTMSGLCQEFQDELFNSGEEEIKAWVLKRPDDRVFELADGWIRSGLSIEDCRSRLMEDGFNEEEADEIINEVMDVIREEE
jgi:hypothetical protein